MDKVYAKFLEMLHDSDYKMRKLSEAYSIASYEITAVAPKAAANQRAKVLAFLSGEKYNLVTSSKVKEIIDYFSQNKDMLNMQDHASLRVFEDAFNKFSKIPADLNQEYTVAKIKSEAQWQISKHKNDYDSMKPYLHKIIECTNAMIDVWGYEESRYDALLKYQEPGMSASKLDVLFAQIRECVVPLTEKILSSNVEVKDNFTRGYFDLEKQKIFCSHLLDDIGFDKRRGVMCESEHPYTSGINYSDVRVTNHYYHDRIFPAVLSILHEGGHGLYEQNVSPQYADSVIGTGIHGGVHEGSSRFWENIVGRSRNFWTRQTPYLKMLFPEQFYQISSEEIYRAINKVNNTFIRIHADELTYNLHIMIRYEIERDIFDGKIKVDSLPEAWNEKTKKYLGICPSNHKEGILQDVHWPSGLFGYFQSYTLGNIYNAQIANTIKKELPNFDELILNGECKQILDVLAKKWYGYGELYTSQELLNKINGEDINAQYLCDYLKNKYSEMYDL